MSLHQLPHPSSGIVHTPAKGYQAIIPAHRDRLIGAIATAPRSAKIVPAMKMAP
jgi:hypothetical protein